MSKQVIIENYIIENDEKVHNISIDDKIINNIQIPPLTKLTLCGDPNLNGDSMQIKNNNDIAIIVNKDEINKILPKILSLKLENQQIEGFSEGSVRDICFYTCSNFSYLNLILCGVLVFIIYKLFNTQ